MLLEFISAQLMRAHLLRKNLIHHEELCHQAASDGRTVVPKASGEIGEVKRPAQFGAFPFQSFVLDGARHGCIPYFSFEVVLAMSIRKMLHRLLQATVSSLPAAGQYPTSSVGEGDIGMGIMPGYLRSHLIPPAAYGTSSYLRARRADWRSGNPKI
jgi:hypothetical protein